MNSIKFKKIGFIVLTFFIITTVLIGYSLWIISDDIEIKPVDKTEQVIIKYFNNQEVTYDGNILLPSPEVLGITNTGISKEDIVYSYRLKDSGSEYTLVDETTQSGPINVGLYEIKVEYELTSDSVFVKDGLQFTINKATYDISLFEFNDETKVYNHEFQQITSSTQLPNGITVSYEGGGIDVNTTGYSVTASFTVNGNYNEIESITKTLTILPKDISLCNAYFEGYPNKLFLNSDVDNISQSLRVKDNDINLILNTDYTTEYSHLTNLNSVNTLTISGLNNYTGVLEVTYNIQLATLLINEFANVPHDFYYSGSNVDISQLFEVRTSNNDLITNATISYSYVIQGQSVSYANLPINASVYIVTVEATLEGYGSAQKDITIRILPKNIASASVSVESGDHTYTSQEIRPGLTSVIINDIQLDETTDYTISYQNNINAGTGNIVLQGVGNYSGSKTISFIIAKANVNIQNIDLSYDNTTRTWDQIKASIMNNIIAFDSSRNINIPLNISNISVYGMHNGVFKYGNIDGINGLKTHSTSVIGSTYKLYLQINDSNINILNDKVNNKTEVRFKYKTVTTELATDTKPENSLTYYTVEDALALNTTIYNAGAQTVNNTNNNFVYTSFSALEPSFTGYNPSNETYEGNTYYSYNLNSKFRLPFNVVDLDYHGAGGKTSAEWTNAEDIAVTAYNLVYSSLYIPSNIKLNIVNGSDLVVGGLIQHTGTVQNRAVLVNDGLIELNGASRLRSFGYTKGTGKIINNDSCYVSDVFKAFDWQSAGVAKGYKDANIFPINQFSCHNISCEVIINSGSYYDCFWTFEMGSINTYQRSDKSGNTNLILIGANGLFNLSSGMVIKNASGGREIVNTNCLNNLNQLTGSNQVTGQKDQIDIYGNCVDSSVKITINAGVINVSMQTGASLGLPLAYMDVSVKNGGNLTMKTSSYIFMPGSSLIIEEGGTLNIGEGSSTNSISFLTVRDAIEYYQKFNIPYITTNGGNCKERIDALFKVQGTLNLVGKSKMSGTVIADGQTGYMNLVNQPNATLKYVTKITDGLVGSNVSYINKTLDSYANFPTNGNYVELNQLTIGEYYSRDNYWYGREANIIFDANGGTFNDNITQIQTGPFTTGASGFVLDSIPNNVTQPTRQYYTFEGWYIDIDENIEAIGNTFFASCYVYAKWSPNPYNIIYDCDNYHESVTPAGTDEIINNNPGVFNIETSTFDLIAPIYNSYVFDGWYLDAEYTQPIFSINGDIIKTLSSNSITLYGMWHPADTLLYKINVYDKDPTITNSQYQLTNTITVLSSNLSKYSSPTDILPTLTNRDNDYQYEYYFGGWYLDDLHTQLFTTFDNVGELDENGNVCINVYAKYNLKTKYTYHFTIPDIPEIQLIIYYKPGINTIPGSAQLPSMFSSYIGNNELVWFNSNNFNNSQYFIGTHQYQIGTENKDLYGDLYYILKDSDCTKDSSGNILSSTVPNGVKNLLIKDMNLSNMTLTINPNGYTSATKSGGFYNLGLEKLILDGVTLKDGTYKRGEGSTGGCNSKTYYGHYYLGLFSNNNLTQVIFRNIPKEHLNEYTDYIFSNNTGTIQAYADDLGQGAVLSTALYVDITNVESSTAPSQTGAVSPVHNLSINDLITVNIIPFGISLFLIVVSVLVSSYIVIGIKKKKYRK